MNLDQQNASLNILLADDDLDDCSFFKKALLGIPIATNLTIVHDGEEVMEYLTANSKQLPDVLFLDLSMPRKTGFECLIEIKENVNLKDLPVVMFTTTLTKAVELDLKLASTLYSMGAQDYIGKPAGFEKLKHVLHLALIRVIEKARLTKKE